MNQSKGPDPKPKTDQNTLAKGPNPKPQTDQAIVRRPSTDLSTHLGKETLHFTSYAVVSHYFVCNVAATKHLPFKGRRHEPSLLKGLGFRA